MERGCADVLFGFSHVVACLLQNASRSLSAIAEFIVTLRAKLSGAVYCNRSCLWVCLFVYVCVCFVGVFVGLLPR